MLIPVRSSPAPTPTPATFRPIISASAPAPRRPSWTPRTRPPPGMTPSDRPVMTASLLSFRGIHRVTLIPLISPDVAVPEVEAETGELLGIADAQPPCLRGDVDALGQERAAGDERQTQPCRDLQASGCRPSSDVRHGPLLGRNRAESAAPSLLRGAVNNLHDPRCSPSASRAIGKSKDIYFLPGIVITSPAPKKFTSLTRSVNRRILDAYFPHNPASGGHDVSNPAKIALGPGPRPGQPLGTLGSGPGHVSAPVRLDRFRLGHDRRGPLLPGRGLGGLAPAQDGRR